MKGNVNMKRFHIHVGVKNLESSVQFYSTLFGQKPVKLKPDYAKWLLDDPKLNFAISTRTGEVGVDHLGIQVEEVSELTEITERLKSADLKLQNEGETTCCYAKSNKAWVTDPAGVAWETYQNMADADVFNEKDESNDDNSCCAPVDESTPSSCCYEILNGKETLIFRSLSHALDFFSNGHWFMGWKDTPFHSPKVKRVKLWNDLRSISCWPYPHDVSSACQN